MPKVNIYNQKGEQVGDLKLSDKVFGTKINESLVHQAVVAQMANERQVLAHTKGRGEVRGGGKKPWKQKGTGRARAGSSRSPIWIGGGVTFGPTNMRNFSKKINRKMKQGALFMVLSDKVASENFVALEKAEASEFKTKAMDAVLKNLEKNFAKLSNTEDKKKKASKNVKRSILIIDSSKDEKVKYSSRNLAGVKFINLENINIVDLLKHKNLILTVEAIKKLEKQYK